VEGVLDGEMGDIYDASALFWQRLKVSLEDGVTDGSVTMPPGLQGWGAFWGAQQRFFRGLCIASKVPAVLQQSAVALAEGKVRRRCRRSKKPAAALTPAPLPPRAHSTVRRHRPPVHGRGQHNGQGRGHG